MQLYHGDCLIESDKIESGSVDLILTDLPYGTVTNIASSEKVKHGMSGKTSWDIEIEPKKIFEIANRILRKNGKMILFSQEPNTSKMTTEAIANVPFSFRIIREKDHFANALIAKKSPVSYYEDVLVFSKNNEFKGLHPLRPYYNQVFYFIGVNKKIIIEKIGQRVDHVLRFNSSQFDLCTFETYNDIISHFNVDKMQGFIKFDCLQEKDNEFKKQFASTFNLWEGNKYKSNILKYKKDYTGHHPTQKPVLLLEDLIKTFSNEGDLVVDLTMGSGSTGVACVNTNRNFIGIEMDDKYFEIATARIEGTKKAENLFT